MKISFLLRLCYTFAAKKNQPIMMISLRLRTNYVIRVMRIKDKGGREINSSTINR
jgi:hypothetical protein